MGRISVEISDELEKKLRFKTIDRFGGKKGDLSRAVEEAVKIWVTKEKYGMGCQRGDDDDKKK